MNQPHFKSLDDMTYQLLDVLENWIHNKHSFSDGEILVRINFASVFIHYAKGLLSKTKEFNRWTSFDEFRPRNIDFSFNSYGLIGINILSNNPSNSLLKFNNALHSQLKLLHKSREEDNPLREPGRIKHMRLAEKLTSNLVKSSRTEELKADFTELNNIKF